MGFSLENTLGFSLEMATKNVFFGLGNVLFNDFEFSVRDDDKKRQIPIQLSHFNLFSSWNLDDPRWAIDQSTMDKYDNDSIGTLRAKCACLFLATPILQSIGLLLNLANRITKLVLAIHFWSTSDRPYQFEERASEAIKDLFRIITTPLTLVGLTFAAAYGTTISPRNGSKLYATLERWAYAGGYHRYVLRNADDLQVALIGLCFQPEPSAHFFGGTEGPDNW